MRKLSVQCQLRIELGGHGVFPSSRSVMDHTLSKVVGKVKECFGLHRCRLVSCIAAAVL